MTLAAILAMRSPTLIALLLLILAVVLLVRPTHGMTPSSLAEQLSVRVMRQLYRNVRLDWHLAIPSLSWLLLMLIAWLLVPLKTSITPDLICWVGVGLALLWRASLGEKLLRTRVDFEAALFLLGLFVMVGAVRRTGLFALLANRLTALPLPPLSRLLLFLVIAG